MKCPAWLKWLILPFWNSGHRLAWLIGEYLDALINRRFDYCSVCGRSGPMLYRRWIIRPELEKRWGLSKATAESMARKESLLCYSCNAKLRTRRLAAVLLELHPAVLRGRPLRSVRSWVACPEARQLRIAQINRIEGLDLYLASLEGLSLSDYHDASAEGASDRNARHEDLTALTYIDASFDMLITSETLEHIPDLEAGLREIHRVLKPRGLLLFTVPLLPEVQRTFARARLTPDGAIDPLAEPLIHHPGGDWGYPVFTEFGQDLPELLTRAGFVDVAIHYGPVRHEDLAQVWSCRKP